MKNYLMFTLKNGIVNGGMFILDVMLLTNSLKYGQVFNFKLTSL